MSILSRIFWLSLPGLMLAYGTWDAANKTRGDDSSSLHLAALALSIYGTGVMFGHIDAMCSVFQKKQKGE